jgi:teichuronic acid biosynthesis glycosyltransferase TuaG
VTTKISVVCPTFNSASFVLPTIESVVNQSLSPYEIVVSDDGSTDETVSLVTSFLNERPHVRAKVIANEHRGPGATRNAGLRRAEGEWVSFIDSDDIWLPRKLEVVAAAISQHPEANFFCHSEHQIDSHGNNELLDYGRWFDPQKPLPEQLYHRNFLSTSAITCGLNLVTESGMFDESLMSAQDYELWLRMSPGIKPYFIREVLGSYCVRNGNITSTNSWLRWKNLVRIVLRHRNKVSPLESSFRVARLTLAFAIQALK